MHLTHSLYLSLKNRSVEILWTAEEKGQVYFYRQCKVNTLKPPPTRQKSGEQEKYGKKRYRSWKVGLLAFH